MQTDDIATALAYETWAISVLWRGADMQEGMAAFLEKRPPKFTGK
jgi:enoyl-CoA hydratase/carnithine racemase